MIRQTLTVLVLITTVVASFSQYNPIKGCIVDASDNCIPNTILTSLPFLRIAPDARGGAMGDVGIAMDPDANSFHYNAANLAFIKDNASLSATYTPWLRDLNLNDVYLAYLSGYKRLDKLQTVGFAFRYFSLGEINFVDNNGGPTGTGKPREFEIGAAYARKLGDNFSASLSGKFLYSNLASGQRVMGIDINSATSFAADFSLAYKKPIKLSGYNAQWGLGVTVSNLGAKVTYTNNSDRDFLPTNLGIGASLKLDFDSYNSIAFGLDINKLLTPTPCSPTMLDENGVEVPNPCFDTDSNGKADWREKSLFDGILGSFSDAQGGFSEELSEFYYSIGTEYWYDKQFAVRAGYYYESPLKGDRQFLTVGFGVKYSVFGLNLSYLVPTNQRRSPLDNTLRFGMNFDLGTFNEQVE